MTNEDKRDIKIWFQNALISIGIFAIIYWLWELLDCIQFGKPQPSNSDSIFGLILAALLYYKIKIKY